VIDLTFEGGAELGRALGSLSQRVSRGIQREALKDAAEPMRKEMSMLAPVEAGKPDLRDTMTISNARGTDAQEVAVAVGPSKAGFYGSFQEFGTSRHGAQPFARPAFDAKAPQALTVLGRALWTALAGRGIGRTLDVPSVVQDEV
jgi:HK97 gp10 family phage protein